METQTYETIYLALDELGLKAERTNFDDSLMVSTGRIFDPAGTYSCQGSANGFGHENKYIAESIEHAMLGQCTTPIKPMKVVDIKSQIEFMRDGLVKRAHQESVVGTVEFKRLSNRQISVHVPAAWATRTKKQDNCGIDNSIYTSSGFSFGPDPESAILHGFLELLERQALSQFLYALDTDTNFLLRQLEPDLWAKDLELRFGGKISIYQLADIISVKTVMVVFYPDTGNSRFPIPQVSSKASMKLGEAFEGAINEMTQILYLYSSEGFEEDTQVLANKDFFEKHRKSILLPEIRTVKRNVHPYAKNYSIYEIVGLLEKVGFFPCFRIAKQFSCGACVVQVFIPGFEKYNLVRQGIAAPVHGNMNL